MLSQGRTLAEHSRGDDGRWALTDHHLLDDRIPLASLDFTLDLAEVYDKVELAR